MNPTDITPDTDLIETLPRGWKMNAVTAAGVGLYCKRWASPYWVAASQWAVPGDAWESARLWIADFERRMKVETIDCGISFEEQQREVDARRFLPWVIEQHTSELSGETASGRELRFGETQPAPYWFDKELKRCKCPMASKRQLCSHQTRGDDNFIRWKCNECGQEFCTFLEG